jgi:NitT/TauT family transport system substrate-binding protein
MRYLTLGVRQFVSVLLAGVIAAAGGCQRSPSALTPVTIAQYGHVLLYLPLYIAKTKGYFAEQGLKVEIVSTGGDEKTFAAVASGSAQYGVADPVFTAIARQQGGGGKVIASLVNGVPFWGVTFRADLAAIRDPSDFAGLRIATYPAPSTNYAVMEDTLRRNKVSNATIVQGSLGSLLAMLKADKADIAVEIEPTVSMAVANGARVVYSVPKRMSEFAFTGLTTSDRQLAANPKQAEKVVRALARALASIHSDFEGALAVAKGEFPEVPADELRAALSRLVDDNVIPTSLILSETAWRNAIELRRSLGDIRGVAPFGENVDMRFVAQAAQ